MVFIMAENDSREQDIILEFVDDINSNKMLKRSLMELKPTPKQWHGFVLCILIGAVVAILSTYPQNTVQISKNICGDILTIQSSILGCIFTVYTILNGFLSDSYVRKLLKVDLNNRTSMLKECTSYYASALFIFFIGVVVSGLVKIFLHCVPDDFYLFDSKITNDILAGIMLCCYYSFSFRVIIELKSAIFNTIALFQTSMAYKIYDIFSENEPNKK